ncbi:porin [Mitsuaria sp. GD03876]|uniref:porin n=1 Tax=Mitsuaria sp. GD03876 TaxID=2975399 RepID=UPI00244C938F|nr:porin [Mitsuaria sp. GD03876]MDH0864757.1 porin [Mitsuaria sp. GD03876]
MKKIAFAAAIAALSVPAFAQSSVTLWGRINTSVESIKRGNNDRVASMINNNSRLGFKGTEDLGSGLKASFALEHGLNSDDGKQTNATAFWNREASVQLAGDFGAVRLGRWTPGSYYATADYVSMHNHDTGTSEDKLYSGAGFTQTNKVGYFTPNINGFNGEFAIHAGEGVDPRGYDVALNYDQGPLHLGAGYSKQGSAKQYAFRGLYELGAFTFGGYLQREESGTAQSPGAKDNRWIGRAAVMYTMGQSEFHLNVGGTKAGAYSFNNGRNGGKQYTLAYNYNLSKRTKVYAFYTAVDANTPNKVDDLSSFALGVRHNF